MENIHKDFQALCPASYSSPHDWKIFGSRTLACDSVLLS